MRTMQSIVRLEGTDETLKALQKVGDALAGHLEEAVLAGAEIVRQDASDRAPRDTGELSANIVKEMDKKSQKGEAVVRIGPHEKIFYGRFVELGTVKMNARPFLFPALESNRAVVRRTIRDKFLEVLLEGGG